MRNTSMSASIAPSRSGRASIAISCLILGLIASDVSGCTPDASQSAAPAAATSSASAPPLTQTPAAAATALPDFTGLVERFGKAVVNIEITGRERTVSTPRVAPDEDPFFDFFRRFGIPAPVPRGGEAPILRGSGSGFIVRSRSSRSMRRISPSFTSAITRSCGPANGCWRSAHPSDSKTRSPRAS